MHDNALIIIRGSFKMFGLTDTHHYLWNYPKYDKLGIFHNLLSNFVFHMQYTPQEGLFKKRGRKKKARLVNYTPTLTVREPTDGTREEGIIKLGHDELEALRLKNINGLGVVSGAKQMGISKSLFAKIHNEATQKITQALVFGRALYIEIGYQEEFGEPLL